MLWLIAELAGCLLLAILVWWLLSFGFWGILALLLGGIALLAVSVYGYFKVMKEPWDEWEALARDDPQAERRRKPR